MSTIPLLAIALSSVGGRPISHVFSSGSQSMSRANEIVENKFRTCGWTKRRVNPGAEEVAILVTNFDTSFLPPNMVLCVPSYADFNLSINDFRDNWLEDALFEWSDARVLVDTECSKQSNMDNDVIGGSMFVNRVFTAILLISICGWRMDKSEDQSVTDSHEARRPDPTSASIAI
jgi:hypothetical protein